MNIENITKIFKDRKGQSIREFKKSAVVIPLIEKGEELEVLFEVRALTLRSQPGDVCFPGGRVDKDETYLEAAIREVIEELNVGIKDIEIIGEMDYFISPYGGMMFPFIGKLSMQNIEFNKDEVDHIFTVPLSFFLNKEPLCYTINVVPDIGEDFPFHLINGGREYKFSSTTMQQYFYEYDNHVIWGFTALIVKRLVDIIKNGG